MLRLGSACPHTGGALAEGFVRRPKGTVDEMAKTAALLLSADAEYITGQNVTVDGGLDRSL